MIKLLLSALFVVLPFVAFLFYGYRYLLPHVFFIYLFSYTLLSLYCFNAVALRPWCSAIIPNLYNFVQSEYWSDSFPHLSFVNKSNGFFLRGVGFLRYYEPKQIPNFLLAAPALGLAFYICFSYLGRNIANLFNLRFIFDSPRKFTISLSPSSSSSRSFDLPSKPSDTQWQNKPFLLAFVLHLLFLALTGLLIMHVQVSTRFLFSQSPLLYWFIADVFSNPRTNPIVRAALFLYHAVFIVVGTALFTNFLPWT